jgi:uncharacterized membrane protein
MESRAKVLGHPLHQQLVPFPLGLLGTAVVFDLIHVAREWPGLARAADYMLLAGIVGGVVAALVGVIDWAAVPSGTRARRVATVHGAGNVGVVGLFAVAWWLRRDEPADPPRTVLLLEVIAAAGALVTAWLGGELIARLAVGVDRGAHLDAPNSLSGRPASESETLPASRRRSFF